MAREPEKGSAPVKPVRCAVYTRVSPQARGVVGPDSLRSQRKDCEAFIRRRAQEGWVQVEAVFEDNGYASTIQDRPGLTRLMARVRDGALDAVVVTDVIRITRSVPRLVELLTEFEEAGVAFATVGLGLVPPRVMEVFRSAASVLQEEVARGK
jgi:DNA invertase Pin-like site-specific DNA recombinase